MDSAGLAVHILLGFAYIYLSACFFTSELSLLLLNGSDTVRARDSVERTILE